MEAECCRAITYGMTAVVDGLDILCDRRDGNRQYLRAAIAHALFGGTAKIGPVPAGR